MIRDINQIKDIEASFYEDDSYAFMQYYPYSQDWTVYSSDDFGSKYTYSVGIEYMHLMASTFCAFHGRIPFPDVFAKYEIANTFWSAVPLGVFRYKMLSNGSFHYISEFNAQPGYIVEGAYWVNGFVCIVRDKDTIIQIKLYVDSLTCEVQGYPALDDLVLE